MAVIKEESKTFPLWFQGAKNANYASEYGRCLKNLPITGQTDSVAYITGCPSGSDNYFGSVLGDNGIIYCPPSDATTILKINTNNDTVSTIGSFAGSGKYSDGVRAANGKIYFIPLNATNILVLDPATELTTTISGLAGGAAFVGGSLDSTGTKIYLTPFNSTSIVVVDTTTDTISTPVGLTGLPVDPNGGKYTRSQLALNGKIYCPPHHTTNILVIDPATDTYTTITGITFELAKYTSINLGLDGFLYCMPYLSTEGVLKINPTANTYSYIPVTSFLQYSTRASIAQNGIIYATGVNGFMTSFNPATNTANYTSVTFTGIQWGNKLAPNGKIYSTPRSSTNLGVILTEQAIDKDLPLSIFNNK
jgi:hypothetical protein